MIVFRSKKVLFYPNFTFANINIELRHNVPTSQRSNIEQERGKNLTLGQSTFCRPGGVPIKKCEIVLFLHFHVYIWRLLRLVVVFSFCGNLTKPCHCVIIAQFVSQQSVPSILDKRHKFNQTTVCSHRRHWRIGVPGCTFACLIHARAIIFLGLCSPVTTGSV